jgi:hypothetical protein
MTQPIVADNDPPAPFKRNATNLRMEEDIASDPDPDSQEMRAEYILTQLCHYCELEDMHGVNMTNDLLVSAGELLPGADLPTGLVASGPRSNTPPYLPCFKLSQTTFCAQLASLALSPVGVCLPCQGGKYCPAKTNSSIAYAYDNLCPAGSYCPSSGTILTCPSGSFCTKGSRHPIPCLQPGTYCGNSSITPLTSCPKGYYCPNPSMKYICPSHYYCRSNSVIPKYCFFFSYCPEGSNVPTQIWTGLFWVIIMLTILAAFRQLRMKIREGFKRIWKILKFLCCCRKKKKKSRRYGAPLTNERILDTGLLSIEESVQF